MLGSILDRYKKVSHHKSKEQGSIDSLQTMLHCTLSTEPCHNDDTDRKCSFNSNFDISFVCVSTTLNCVNYCTAVINTQSRGCQFMNVGANVSQPIYCCLCNSSDTSPLKGQTIWDCNITTPTLIPSGEHAKTSLRPRLNANIYLQMHLAFTRK